MLHSQRHSTKGIEKETAPNCKKYHPLLGLSMQAILSGQGIHRQSWRHSGDPITIAEEAKLPKIGVEVEAMVKDTSQKVLRRKQRPIAKKYHSLLELYQ